MSPSSDCLLSCSTDIYSLYNAGITSLDSAKSPFSEKQWLAVCKAGNHMVLMIGFTEFCAGIRTKHVRKKIIFPLIPTYYAIKCTYLLIIQANHSSKCFSTMYSNFPQKSKQSRNIEINICSDLCGKLLHILE